MPDAFDITTIDLPADSEVHALLRVCPDVEGLRFTNDEFVVHGEDTAMDIYLVLKGNCLVEQPDAPRERTPGSELAVIMASPDSPVFIGEMAYLGGGYRTASVRSVMATYALRLKTSHLDTIMSELPGMTRILCGQFAQRLGEANAFIKAYQTNNAMDASQRFLSPGDLVVAKGAPAKILYQIVDGAVEEQGDVSQILKHGEADTTFIHPREFFAGKVHPCDVVAKSPCIVVGLGVGRKEAIVRNFPKLALELLEGVTDSPA